MQVQELVKAKIKNKKALFYQGLFGNQKGQAVVEFALVLPFLFFLLCGMLSIGFWAACSVTSSAYIQNPI
jgi:Flp pilus assembly protein TadG